MSGCQTGADTGHVTSRRAFSALASVGACLLLAGCGVPVGSAVAIGVDTTGRPVGYVLVCGGTVDTTTFWDAKTQDYTGGWTAKDTLDPGVFSNFNLTDPGNGWRISDTAFAGLKPGKQYEFRAYGGNDEQDVNQWSSTYVDFTSKDLAALPPDQVRYWAGTTEDGQDLFNTVTVDEFKAKGCAPVTGT